jgi:hypothetical protein
MSNLRRANDPTPTTELGVIAVAVLAVACCVGGPLLVALASTVALGTVLGIGAGVLSLGVMSALVLLRARRRRAAVSSGRVNNGREGL